MQDIDNTILRPVSILEYNARKFGIVVSRNRIKGRIAVEQIRRALRIITERHPFLSAAFIDIESKPFIKRIEKFSIPLTVKENIKTESGKEALYEDELNTPINPYERLWRVLLILEGTEDDIDANSSMEMIISLQHAVCDGLSILNLAKEILEQIQAVQKGLPLYEDNRLPVTPPFDEFLPDILKSPGTKPDRGRTIDYEKMDILGRDLSIPKESCRIHYVGGRYSEENMRRLCSRCKDDHVSIHGLMAASMIKAIAESINNPSGKELHLLLRNPVSRRKQVSPPLGNQALSCFVASELIVCSIGKMKTTLEIGRQIMHDLDHDIKINKALTRYQAVVDSVLNGQMDKEKYVQVLTLSNAGMIDTPADYGQFELLGTNFISSNKHHAIQLSFTTFMNRLDYVMLYTHPWYQTDLMQRLNRRFMELLFEFLDNPRNNNRAR